MPFEKLYIIPASLGIMFPAIILLIYILAAVVNKNTPLYFPYISDTGAHSLERCLFCLLLGIGAILIYLTIYIRYRQVGDILIKYEADFEPLLYKMNKITVYMGFGSTFFIFVTGCFPVSDYGAIHISSACLAFFLGALIIVMQTYLSFRISPYLGWRELNIFRLVITVIVCVSYILSGIFGIISLTVNGKYVTSWTADVKGYIYHVHSAVNEWIFVLGTIFYLSLYTFEFKTLVMDKPILRIDDVEV